MILSEVLLSSVENPETLVRLPEDLTVDEEEARYDVFCAEDYDKRQPEEGDVIVIGTTKGTFEYTFGSDFDMDDTVLHFIDPQ